MFSLLLPSLSSKAKDKRVRGTCYHSLSTAACKRAQQWRRRVHKEERRREGKQRHLSSCGAATCLLFSTPSGTLPLLIISAPKRERTSVTPVSFIRLRACAAVVTAEERERERERQPARRPRLLTQDVGQRPLPPRGPLSPRPPLSCRRGRSSEAERKRSTPPSWWTQTTKDGAAARLLWRCSPSLSSLSCSQHAVSAAHPDRAAPAL